MALSYDPVTGLVKQKQKLKLPGFTGDPGSFTTMRAADPGADGMGSMPAADGRGTIRIPGYMPDYKSLIANDPVFSQLKQDLAAQGIQDAGGRASAVQRALIQFGQVPDFNATGLNGLNPEWLNQDVTDQTRQLASQNTESGMSVTARQASQFDKNLRAIKNALAARGALRSGETGYQLGEAQKQYDTQRYDSTQELLDYIAGAQQGFTAAERARQAQAAQAAESAAGRQIELNPPSGGQELTPDPSVPDGYRNGRGELVNADGTPYAAKPPADPTSGLPDPSVSADPARQTYIDPDTGIQRGGNTQNTDSDYNRFLDVIRRGQDTDPFAPGYNPGKSSVIKNMEEYYRAWVAAGRPGVF